MIVIHILKEQYRLFKKVKKLDSCLSTRFDKCKRRIKRIYIYIDQCKM